MPVSQSIVGDYLAKSALFPALIQELPDPYLEMIIVIPCFNERDYLQTLNSLLDCEPPFMATEVLIIVNQPENATPEICQNNLEAYQNMVEFSRENNRPALRFLPVILERLPPKHAGVGLARKAGMDEAVRRLLAVNRENSGIIVCLDADCTVAPNYLRAIESFFRENPVSAANIHFEHPLENYSGTPNRAAIIEYELHLRYFRHIQEYAGFPFFHYTVGSAMAVRCAAYCRQGGMNRRKAGEDFYFLQKFISLGQLDSILNTTVYPSARISDRVPFGTGKAVGDRLRYDLPLHTYSPETFRTIKLLFNMVEELFEPRQSDETFLSSMPLNVRSFLINNEFLKKINEIRANTSNRVTFANRFFQWFNAFLIVKYAHYSRDNYFPNVPVTSAANWLASHYYNHNPFRKDLELLQFYRFLDLQNANKLGT